LLLSLVENQLSRLPRFCMTNVVLGGLSCWLLYRHTCVAFGVISSFSILCIGRRAFDLFLSGGHGVCETDRDHPSQKRGLCDFWGARRVRIIGTNLCAKNANRVARKSSAAAEMDFPVGWSLITFLPNTRRRLLKIIKCS
jgi:hypothetical protein